MSHSLPSGWTVEQVAGRVEHTLLRPEAGMEQLDALCREAVAAGFAAVCVFSVHAGVVADRLRGTAVKPCAVIAFPSGAVETAVKVAEAESALASGAQELDMVLRIDALKEGRDDLVRSDIQAVASPVQRQGAQLKVIIETGLLTDAEKKRACRLCVEAGADFVKTSTGCVPGGATVEDIRLMARALVGSGLKIKASGGIRTLDEMIRMAEAGALRIGTRSGLAIVQEARVRCGMG